MSIKSGFTMPDCLETWCISNEDTTCSQVDSPHEKNEEVQLVKQEEILYEDLHFYTTQNYVPIPTKELILRTDCDFRILIIVCILSNVDMYMQAGDNVRYMSLSKFDRNLDRMHKLLGLSKKRIRNELKKLLDQGSSEFSLVVREYKGITIHCIQVQYKAGGFVRVPIDDIHDKLLKCSSKAIKMFINLLWLCWDRSSSSYIETLVYQDTLLKNMGYKPSSRSIITDASKELEHVGLIRIRREYDCKTIVVDGEISVSTPKKQCFYSILI
ncbi:MAG: hypothetical protein Q4F05_02500 [bacterium]|nr:hypothetical protein [bacterium]